MRLVDGDALLEKWRNLSERGRIEFDQVIMCEPTVNAIVVTDRKKHVSNFDFDDNRSQCCIDHDVILVSLENNTLEVKHK